MNEQERAEAELKIVELLEKDYPNIDVDDFIMIAVESLYKSFMYEFGVRNSVVFVERLTNFLKAQFEHADNGEYGYIIEEE